MAATYTVKQVAEILGYSTNSIYSFLKEKRIKGVRVGKGRFRIPQSELNRLLLISRGQDAAVVDQMIPALPAHDPKDIPSHEIEPFSLPFLGLIHTVSANIFDWFIGVAAIVSGVALFLFNQTFDFVNPQPTGPVLPAVRILLIGGGFGILLTNLYYEAHHTWHKVFHGVLVAAGLVMTVFLLLIRDFDGIAIYGALTAVIALTMFVRLGNIFPFVLYLILISVIGPFVVFLAPWDFHISAVASYLHGTPAVLGALLVCVSAGFAYVFWRGLSRTKAIFWVSSYGAAIVYLFLSFIFANYQFWSRAFFFMIIGLTCMYLPMWEDLVESRSKTVHTLALGVFAAILGLILVGNAVVFIFQQNVIATIRSENMQKVDYARVAFESDIQSVKSTVTTASINANLVAAVEKRDDNALTDLSRIIFDSSDSIRRLVILDKNGQGVFVYPWGTFDRTDLSFRDYFIQARDTGKLHVSDVFESLIDNARRKVITVAAPMYSSGEFVGVLTASVDLTAIGARLQKIAVQERGEYITVLDSRGKRIIHPEISLIGTDTTPGDPSMLGSQGKTGVEENYTYEGVRSLVAYTGINDSSHWAIALKAPYSKIYALSGTASVVVASLLIDCIVVAALILQLGYLYARTHKSDGGSP